MATIPRLRDDLRGLAPYAVGKDMAPVRLNNNENPHGPADGMTNRLMRAVRESLATINRYPGGSPERLAAALAEYVAPWCRSENIWPGNGSNEALLYLLLAFGGPQQKAMLFAPTYAMHEQLCRITATPVAVVARDDDFALRAEAAAAAMEEHEPTLVFLCSPNNPTGTPLPPDVIATVLRYEPSLLIIDEAYFEYSQLPSAVSLVRDHPNVVVARTMSKAFAFAGARVGYAVGHAQVCAELQKISPPYRMSTITEALAMAALEMADLIPAQVAMALSERERVRTELESLGYRVADSDANFLLFGTVPDDHAEYEYYRDRGVLIRNVGPRGWLRTAIGEPAENDSFLACAAERRRTSRSVRFMQEGPACTV
ncbi:histidinol-phosphate transaminase [Actinoallomurus iriomotensis]|uniref:Histidinol-phosphate aminotransferase n=1 Tax=Actinoallomurus iriomotensis TaxID=478107 RepID=A0A9W6VRD8_9ACTN|nr:histidinol-phosphate transaminase [Actinoallomurus iriomotensis]GLY82133.1 histidinol-phosphate aminotransferase [Actinoallomurus iriomotensis]